MNGSQVHVFHFVSVAILSSLNHVLFRFSPFKTDIYCRNKDMCLSRFYLWTFYTINKDEYFWCEGEIWLFWMKVANTFRYFFRRCFPYQLSGKVVSYSLIVCFSAISASSASFDSLPISAMLRQLTRPLINNPYKFSRMEQAFSALSTSATAKGKQPIPHLLDLLIEQFSIDNYGYLAK